MLFTKLFPIISIWEIQEGREVGVSETVKRIKSYLPTEDSKDKKSDFRIEVADVEKT